MSEVIWGPVRQRLGSLLPAALLEALESAEAVEVFTDSRGRAYVQDARGCRRLGVTVSEQAADAALEALEGNLEQLEQAFADAGIHVRVVGLQPPFAARTMVSLRRFRGEGGACAI